MELLHRLVQRRPVDDRVVRCQRNTEHVRVLVLERAGQVVVDLVEAQRQRLAWRRPHGLAGWLDRIEGSELFEWMLNLRSGSRYSCLRGQVQRFQHEG